MDNQDQPNIYETAAERILENLKTKLGGNFKAYFFGDPFAIPKSLYPCIIVDVDQTNNQLGPTGHDRISQTIIVKVVRNKQDDFGGDTKTSLTKRKLMLDMEARDDTTKQYLPESVLGIVRTFLTLNNEIEYSEARVAYGVVERAFTEATEMLAAEAVLTITTSELIQVDNRT